MTSNKRSLLCGPLITKYSERFRGAEKD